MGNKQAYVVVVGLKPGVYKDWLDAMPNVVGVPGAQYQGFTYWDEAAKYYERAHRKGATKKVSKPPPSPEDEEQPQCTGRKKQLEGRSDGGRQRRRKREDSPAGSVQAPSSKGSSAGKAARDAQIAAALAEARKNRIGPSASSASVISSERRRTNKSSRRTALARSATEPAYHLQPQVQGSWTSTVSARTPSRPARRTVELPTPEPEPRPRTPETKTASESGGPSSDIPTHQTQTRNRFTDSPSTPRYAQSLSYASSPSELASSDLRTHLSSPSSFGTRYFPEDWLARLGQGDREVRGEDRSSVLSVSEYATAPNTPEMGSIELEDEDEDEVEDTRGLGIASPSPSARDRVGLSEPSSSRSAVNRSKTWSSAMPSPATATEVISSPSATSTPRRTSSMPNSVNDRFSPSVVPSASVPPSSPTPEPKHKTATRVTQSSNEAEVQINSHPRGRVCRCKIPEASGQAAPPSPPKRQYLDDRVQTSPAASPLRASTGVGDIPVHPSVGGAPCACEHPEYACVHCGQRPRTERRSARSAMGHSRSSQALSTSPTTASPAPSVLSAMSSSPTPSATPAPAVPSSVSSCSTTSRSLVGGHTPLMGPSEYPRSPSTRLQETLGMMSFSEAARGVGAEAVVHDVSFDPRSPIQRGTSIPAGTSGSAVRPSPAMAPVPMGSLGLLFPSPS